MADQGAVSDKNAALILKLATHVDKHVFSHMDVLSTVRVKRREQGKGLIYRPAGQFGEKGPQFFRFMISMVDFRCNFQGFLADPMHK